ncbi:MAG TPA: YciI family protein [Gemmataceae bacterium]|jgi:hypothetical protein|nr:YciI family protein [Gemmataceae bacterium]
MKYMMLIYMEPNAMTDAQREDCFVESTQLAHNLAASGQYLGANPLHPTTTATSVRVRDGKTLVTDGPFMETREHLGGYFLIDAKNREEAIGIAARIPGARKGTVEVRPVQEIPVLSGAVADRRVDGAGGKRYLLLCYTDEKHWQKVGEAARQKAIEQAVQQTQQIIAKGQYLSSAPLQPTSTAISVRVRDGKQLVTDGPFAETREQLGGYYHIDAKDLDEAIGIAARLKTCEGTIEIRPILELTGLPNG